MNQNDPVLDEEAARMIQEGWTPTPRHGTVLGNLSAMEKLAEDLYDLAWGEHGPVSHDELVDGVREAMVAAREYASSIRQHLGLPPSNFWKPASPGLRRPESLN